MRIDIDHIGYAVKDINAAVAAFEMFGYMFGELVNDDARNVIAVMGQLGSTKVELLTRYGGGYKEISY